MSSWCESTGNSSGEEFEAACEGNTVEEVLSSAEDKSVVLCALGRVSATPRMESDRGQLPQTGQLDDDTILSLGLAHSL
jgi:hypothetical protein